ncbi:hypothetical protein JCM10908_003506 [Rhodotorula pacifica]|uniref:uncharacterized protein n=1 Tax=Rhodotorula pacifica TaxID=1495444 RepID=UPI00316D4386
MTLKATLNCDCGESFGQYTIGDDEGLFPIVDIANCACGEHGGDFNVMAATVKLAQKHGVKIGAHPSLPDRQGFGRRKMYLPTEDFFNCLLAQTGALAAFLKLNGLEFNHFKPHGQAYLMSANDLEMSRASARVAKLYGVPMLGLPGSKHQEACELEGVGFIPEFYADLQYGEEGQLLGPASASARHATTPDAVYERVRQMLLTGTWKSVSGEKTLSFPEGIEEVSICVHGDFPGAVETAKAVKRAIEAVASGQATQ